MTNQEAILYMVLYRAKLLDSVSDLDKDIEAYDMAIEALTAIDDIKQEIFNAIDNVPITLSRNDADNLLKMNIQDIIDKYRNKEG